MSKNKYMISPITPGNAKTGIAETLLSLLIILTLTACGQKVLDQATDGNRAVQTNTTTENANQISVESQQMFDQGIAAMALQDYVQAADIFSRLSEANPSLSGPVTNLALIEFKKENYDHALLQTNKAIELNPEQAQAFQLRAQIRLKRGEIKKARDDYQMAVTLDPAYTNAHYNLALLYDIYLQEIALAIEHYNIYLSLLDKEDEKTRDWVNHLKGTLENG